MSSNGIPSVYVYQFNQPALNPEAVPLDEEQSPSLMIESISTLQSLEGLGNNQGEEECYFINFLPSCIIYFFQNIWEAIAHLFSSGEQPSIPQPQVQFALQEFDQQLLSKTGSKISKGISKTLEVWNEFVNSSNKFPCKMIELIKITSPTLSAPLFITLIGDYQTLQDVHGYDAFSCVIQRRLKEYNSAIGQEFDVTMNFFIIGNAHGRIDIHAMETKFKYDNLNPTQESLDFEQLPENDLSQFHSRFPNLQESAPGFDLQRKINGSPYIISSYGLVPQ
jgi:hypothetical protein